MLSYFCDDRDEKMKKLISFICLLLPTILQAQTLTLEACIEKAQRNYPAVKQYSLIEKSRDYSISNAAKGWLPQIGVSVGGYAFTDIVDGDVLDVMGVDMENWIVNGAVTVSQNIYDGGQIAANKRVTHAEAEVELRELDVTMYDIDERVQQIFFGILVIDEQIRQNGLLQEDLEISRNSVESMMKGGIANESDLEAVKVEQVKAKQQLGALQSSRKAYLRMLGVFIGEKVEGGSSLVIPTAKVGATWSENYEQRPEMAYYSAAEKLVDEQNKKLNARLRPTLGAFVTGMIHNSVTDMVNNGVIAGGLSLSWNIGALYTRKNDLMKLDIQRSTIESERETFIFNTRLQNADSNGAIESLRTQISQDDEIVRLRESIRSKSEKKVELGTESVSEMLRDINAVSQARQQKALHEIQLTKEIYNLNHIIGREK